MIPMTNPNIKMGLLLILEMLKVKTSPSPLWPVLVLYKAVLRKAILSEAVLRGHNELGLGVAGQGWILHKNKESGHARGR